MITAKDAVTKLTDEDEAAVKAAEIRIDKLLSEYEGYPICVGFEGTSTRRKVLERLCSMYREHGWTAVIQSGDQREPGPWIKFDVASPPRSGPGC